MLSNRMGLQLHAYLLPPNEKCLAAVAAVTMDGELKAKALYQSNPSMLVAAQANAAANDCAIQQLHAHLAAVAASSSKGQFPNQLHVKPEQGCCAAQHNRDSIETLAD